MFQNGVPASAEQRSGDLNGVGLVLLQVVVSSWTLNEVRAGGGEAVLPETHGRKAASWLFHARRTAGMMSDHP